MLHIQCRSISLINEPIFFLYFRKIFLHLINYFFLFHHLVDLLDLCIGVALVWVERDGLLAYSNSPPKPGLCIGFIGYDM